MPSLHRRKRYDMDELCPVCLRRFRNQVGATAHYRAHARRGALLQVGAWYKWNGVWFDHGIVTPKEPAIVREPEALRARWEQLRRVAMRLAAGFYQRLDARQRAADSKSSSS